MNATELSSTNTTSSVAFLNPDADQFTTQMPTHSPAQSTVPSQTIATAMLTTLTQQLDELTTSAQTSSLSVTVSLAGSNSTNSTFASLPDLSDLVTTASVATQSVSSFSSSAATPTLTTASSSPTVYFASADYWQRLLLSLLVDLIRIINFLQDNLDKLLVYLIVSITSSLIIVLVGVTIKIIIARNAKQRQKQSHYCAEGEYMEIAIVHNRSQSQQKQVAVQPAINSPPRQQPPSEPVDLAKQRNHHRRNGHRPPRPHSMVVEPAHSTAQQTRAAKGLDRLSSQQYVQSPRASSTLGKGKHMSTTFCSPPRNASGKHAARQGGAVSFSQSVSDITRPILRGEVIPQQNFQVVRFQPQLSRFSSSQLTSSFHDDNFDDFGE